MDIVLNSHPDGLHSSPPPPHLKLHRKQQRRKRTNSKKASAAIKKLSQFNFTRSDIDVDRSDLLEQLVLLLSATARQRLFLRLTRRRHAIIVALSRRTHLQVRLLLHRSQRHSEIINAHTKTGRERALPLTCQIFPKSPFSLCQNASKASSANRRREKSMIEFHIAQLCVAGKSFYAPNIYFVINLQTQNPIIIGWKDLKSVIKWSAWNNVGRSFQDEAIFAMAEPKWRHNEKLNSSSIIRKKSNIPSSSIPEHIQLLNDSREKKAQNNSA